MASRRLRIASPREAGVSNDRTVMALMGTILLTSWLATATMC